MNKLNFQNILIIVLVIILAFFAWRLELIKSDSNTQSTELKKSIIAADSLVKEADGRYAKLVNYYNSESDLKKELQKSNADLYKVIKKQDERILSLTTSVITLRSKVEDGFGKFNPDDTNQIQLALRYPDRDKPFIKWDGLVDRRTAQYLGNWTFGELQLQLILTEEKRGLWKHRLVGPEWLVVDSLRIESLPPEKYVSQTDRKIQFLLGGGVYRSMIDPRELMLNIGAGVNYANRHSVIVNATSRQELGLNYYYRFNSTKRTK